MLIYYIISKPINIIFEFIKYFIRRENRIYFSQKLVPYSIIHNQIKFSSEYFNAVSTASS